MKFLEARLKILYGLNGIGSGHIARARLLVPKLQAAGADVTCLLSGRAAEDCPDLSELGDVQFRQGLAIDFSDGQMNFLKTSLGLGMQAPRLIMDIKNLDAKPYDLVISDFEPITAWAAKLDGTPSVGIANHHSFALDVPKVGAYSPFMLFMNKIVPVDTALPSHYDHFDQPILPPFKSEMASDVTDPKKILVYMNYENTADIVNFVEPCKNHDFYIYSRQISSPSDQANLHFRPLSKDGFKRDFQTCSGIITNAGYMSTTEALQMGKKMLIRPIEGQKEQESNALALQQLGYATTMDELDKETLTGWLKQSAAHKITYPDTAQAIVDWIMAGDWKDSTPLVESLWEQVEYDTADLDAA